MGSRLKEYGGMCSVAFESTSFWTVGVKEFTNSILFFSTTLDIKIEYIFLSIDILNYFKVYFSIGRRSLDLSYMKV